MLQVYVKCFSGFQMYVSSVLLQKFIWMLYNMHVASVCFKCFRCFICIFELFYLYVIKIDLDVACVCNGCHVFSGVLQLFQKYVASVSTISDICCKCFI